MAEALYTRFKDQMPEVKTYVSDPEILVLNRHDFVLNEVSPVNSFLSMSSIQASYSYRLYMSLLDMFAGNLNGDQRYRILAADPSLILAAFYVWIRSGANTQLSRVFAPRGVIELKTNSKIIMSLWEKFSEMIDKRTSVPKEELDVDEFIFVLGSTKKADQTIYAADKFNEVRRGVLALKDFSKISNFHERAYLENHKIFVSVTLEGNAYAIRM